jgi:mannose-1-phosphate guanylyltransferase
MPANYYIAIMAGGVGSRFWPQSRSHCPKQFLDILGIGKTLLQLTVARFEQLVPLDKILIVTNAQYADLVRQQLPQLAEWQILCEPSRNNTAPCIAYTAFRLQAIDPKATFVVAPSDHIIMKEEAFIGKIRTALEYASQNPVLLTLGIQPTRPDTGYGYIHYELPTAQSANPSVCKVNRFCEKPNLETAQAFVASGEYLWNAGIFVWNVQTILEALARYSPEVFQLFQKGQGLYNTPKEAAFIQTHYPQSPNISIDYAVMETAENIHTLPADIGWSDLGTWASLYEELPKDEHQNALSVTDKSLIISQDCTQTLIKVPADKLVVVRGLDNFIVVDTPNALLIYPKNQEQEIKKVVQQIKQDKYL